MSYNEFLKRRTEYQANNKRLVEQINLSKDVPQEILWQKEIAELLKDDSAKFETIDGKFYFTETMVNKLMWFSYMKGCDNFKESSYQKGWDDCIEDVRERLEL